MGLIGTAAWLASVPTGRYYGLSVTEPIYGWFSFLLTGESGRLGWAAFMFLGLIGGSHWAARRAGEFQWRAPGATRLLQALGGGLLMGVGAGIAGGCNIGHSLTGIPLLSLGSLAATGAIILGVWAGAYLMFGAQAFVLYGRVVHATKRP